MDSMVEKGGMLAVQTRLDGFRKRDGLIVPFQREKITGAVRKASENVTRHGGVPTPADLPEQVTDRVLEQLSQPQSEYYVSPDHQGQRIAHLEDVQDLVEVVLAEMGQAAVVAAYKRYRKLRELARDHIRVRDAHHGASKDVTDASLLLVESVSADETLPWDRARIIKQLTEKIRMPAALAASISKAVENQVIACGLRTVSTKLIRELVNNELEERGCHAELEDLSLYSVPRDYIDQLMFTKSVENSNIVNNNPEAVNLGIAELILKQWAMDTIFSPEVKHAHNTGAVHLHDLGYPHRVYCSSHSVEYVKKYGLMGLSNLNTESKPARSASVLTGHLNTFLASMQAYYAGALGVGFINIFYAPYLEGMSDAQMLQEAQHLIFSCSQSAFSRGGQTLFLDFNVHTGIPGYLKDIPAIGPKGQETGKTYGEYEELAQRFLKAMLKVWHHGDRDGHLFAFPKCDLHVTRESFSDPKQRELLEYACQIASDNGVPYFVFDRPAANDKESVTLSACCRLRTTISDDYMIKHPESMRFCGFQNVTINLPQAAYRAGKGNWEGFKAEVFRGMDLALKAHLQKKEFIGKLMSGPSMPLWEIGKAAKDGKPYVDLEKCTYIIGLIGLNEAMQFMTGRELHESDAVLLEGMKIISHMQNRTKVYTAENNLKFTLEESPAESASRRLAKIDYRDYPESRELLRGDAEADELYYTNSIHLRPDAPVDLMTRIEKQAKFHVMIESGAIIHAFVGEERPPTESILALVRKTFDKTKAAQLTISPEFTICNDCNKVTGRLQETCGHCESDNVYGMTRIVGYFSRVNNWNKSKLGEVKDRHKGNYSVAGTVLAAPAVVPVVAQPPVMMTPESSPMAATAAAGS